MNLCEVLDIYSKDDLKNFAKELGLTKLSTLKKGELAEKIVEELLNPAVMSRRMGFLTDQQMLLFEMAVQMPFEIAENQRKDAEVLLLMDYAYVSTAKYLVVPDDVKEAYSRVNTVSFHHRRKQMVWLDQCLYMANMIYCVTPVEMMVKMYQSRPKFEITEEELLSLFGEMPADLAPSVLTEDGFVDPMFADDENRQIVLKEQGDVEFDLPKWEEIESYAHVGYPAGEEAFADLDRFLQEYYQMSKEQSAVKVGEIWSWMARDARFSDIVNQLNADGLLCESKERLETLVGLLQRANNVTRKMPNRGWKPDELHKSTCFEAREDEKEQLAQYMAANGMGQPQKPVVRETPKVYPNDPCPCGSGKKYKKCCGKNV